MKPVVLASVSALLLGTVSAFAEDCSKSLGDGMGCLMLGSTIAPSLLTSGYGRNKEAYVNQLRDDAAEYVTNRENPSALLLDSIRQVREHFPQANQETDLEITYSILGSL